MKKTTQLLTITTTALLCLGCSNQELQVAQTLANSAASASASTSGSNVGTATVGNMLSSSAAQQGVAQSQVIGAQMMMNPAVLGVGAIGTAINEKNMAKNREGFSKVTELAVNSDQANNSMQNMMVRAYNQKHGTNFKTFTDIQDFAKVTGYNKQQGTQFNTLAEVREHYNKQKGTNFQTDQEFRDWIAKNRS